MNYKENGTNRDWTEKDWLNWLMTTDFEKDIKSIVESNFFEALKLIKRAYRYAFLFSCIGPTFALIVTIRLLREPYLNWAQVTSIIFAMNMLIATAWFTTFKFMGTSLSRLPYRIQDEIAENCGKTILNPISTRISHQLHSASDSRSRSRTQENWYDWVKLNGIDTCINATLGIFCGRMRKVVSDAWSYSLAFGCGGTILLTLGLGWFIHIPSMDWSTFISLLFVTTATAFIVWLTTYWLIGIPQLKAADRIRVEIVSRSEETFLSKLSSLLYAREPDISNERQCQEDNIQTSARNLSLEELDALVLTKLSGAKFTESTGRHLKIYFSKDQCERCKAPLRSSKVRPLAISAAEAQAAGLERANTILPRPVVLLFRGNAKKFEEFFKRPMTVEDILLTTTDGFNFCITCSEIAISSGLLHKQPQDNGCCPICATPIRGAQVYGHPGDHDYLVAKCEDCHNTLRSDGTNWCLQ